ncbi:thioredoxin-disulfide reductase [Candidatus Marinamargulisbacteria bacterium SCGC AG-343-D04]|nr:thioredoxin-disulfide reductase [Candidatus Marinamargulisbacteria bacterium SCGC AG-343-D04]
MSLQEELSLLKEKDVGDNSTDFDIAIIGAGPAGMSAALCAARARLNVILLDRNLPGGQTSTAYKISNYLGFPSGVLGSDLSIKMEDHLNDYGVLYKCESVEDILDISGNIKCIKTDLGNDYRVRGVILCLGLEPKPLETKFEKTFFGRGISYYAQADIEKYRDQDVAVIGGGNCACYAADYLSQFVNKLYLIHRSDFIKAVKNLKKKIMENPKIDTIWNTQLVDAFGIDTLEKIKLLNGVTQQETWLDVKGVFIYVGRIPPKDIIRVDLNIDEDGFIITDEFMRTNIPGIYAAGDIRSKQIRQIPTAVSDGMIAAINLDKDLF